MAKLNVQIEEKNLVGPYQVTMARLEGAVDSTTAKQFEDQMQQFIDSGIQYLILLFEGIQYVNSTGMGILIKVTDRFRANGGDVCLVNVSQKIIALFDMLGLLAVLPIKNNLEEALEHLKSIAIQKLPQEEDTFEPVEEFQEVQFEDLDDDDDEDTPYPIEFDCPVCQSRIEILEEGKFKCPKCGCYFISDQEGDVQALRLEESKMIELRLPSDTTFIDGLRTMTKSFGREFNYSDQIIEIMDQGIDEAFAMVVRMAQDPQELCNVFMVGNSEELITGVFSGGKRFDTNNMEVKLSMKIIENSMDEVQIVDLPSGGQLLKMKKIIQPPLEIQQ